MLVGRRVVDDLGPVLRKERLHPPSVADVRHQDLDATPQLQRQVVQPRLTLVQGQQPRRVVGQRLAADLGPDRPRRAGHQHPLALQHPATRLAVHARHRPAQQVVDLHLAQPTQPLPVVQQPVQHVGQQLDLGLRRQAQLHDLVQVVALQPVDGHHHQVHAQGLNQLRDLVAGAQHLQPMHPHPPLVRVVVHKAYRQVAVGRRSGSNPLATVAPPELKHAPGQQLPRLAGADDERPGPLATDVDARPPKESGQQPEPVAAGRKAHRRQHAAHDHHADRDRPRRAHQHVDQQHRRRADGPRCQDQPRFPGARITPHPAVQPQEAVGQQVDENHKHQDLRQAGRIVGQHRRVAGNVGTQSQEQGQVVAAGHDGAVQGKGQRIAPHHPPCRQPEPGRAHRPPFARRPQPRGQGHQPAHRQRCHHGSQCRRQPGHQQGQPRHRRPQRVHGQYRPGIAQPLAAEQVVDVLPVAAEEVLLAAKTPHHGQGRIGERHGQHQHRRQEPGPVVRPLGQQGHQPGQRKPQEEAAPVAHEDARPGEVVG